MSRSGRETRNFSCATIAPDDDLLAILIRVQRDKLNDLRICVEETTDDLAGVSSASARITKVHGTFVRAASVLLSNRSRWQAAMGKSL